MAYPLTLLRPFTRFLILSHQGQEAPRFLTINTLTDLYFWLLTGLSGASVYLYTQSEVTKHTELKHTMEAENKNMKS